MKALGISTGAMVSREKTPRIKAPKRIDNPKFIRLKIIVNNKTTGWALVLVTSLSNHNYFGNMKIGSLIDCLFTKGLEAEIIALIKRYFIKKNVDLIISNQSCGDINFGFLKNGFIEGPSNFILAVSPKLSKVINLNTDSLKEMHINRGDGDGPIHL